MIVASMVSQHVKWLEVCSELPWRTKVPSLNILLNLLAQRLQRLQPPGTRLHGRTAVQARPYLRLSDAEYAIASRLHLGLRPFPARSAVVLPDHCLACRRHVSLTAEPWHWLSWRRRAAVAREPRPSSTEQTSGSSRALGMQ